jgi:hypothetical protein
MENTQFRIIDRLLSPRGSFETLVDARAALAGFPGGFVEGYNYVEGVWIPFQEVTDQ